MKLKADLLARIFLSLFLVFALTSKAFADDIFNIKEANAQFDKLSIKLATQNLNEDDIQSAIVTLESLQAQATACLNKTNKMLDKLNKTEKEILTEDKSNNQNYITNKKDELLKIRSDCNIFVFRAEEAISAYKDVLNKISTKKLLLSNSPIWKMLPSLLTHYDSKKLFSLDKTKEFKLYLSSLSYSMPTVVLFIAAIGLLSLYFRSLLRNIIKNLANDDVSHAISLSIKKYLIPVVISVLLLIESYKYSTPLTSNPLGIVAAYSLFLFVFLVLASFVKIFYAAATDKLISNSKRLMVLAWLFFVTKLLADYFVVSSELKNVIYISISAIFLYGYTKWLKNLIGIFNFPETLTKYFLFSVDSFLFSAVIATGTLGYYQIGIFMMESVFLSTFCVVIFMLCHKLIKHTYDYLNDTNLYAGMKIRELLSVESDKSLIELALLKVVMECALLGLTVAFLISIWGVTINFSDLIEDTFLYSINIGPVSFSIFRLIIGLTVFSFTLILGRIISSLIVDKNYYKKNDDTQIILSSAILYTSFAIATIVGLIAMGVSFTGLSIIAGALSVGVGFGLQNIVNNFISGLILLIEQPIKPGDRVIVGNTEGIVKKIRIRSTQIKTMAREDVIVPNSELIANQVTNYMYKDKYFRIACKVGVAYGSNTTLVTELLNEVAINHPEVLNTPTNFPKVLFRQFGDNSLMFELWCTIKDVNNKFIVQSELNYAINEAFRKNNVVIAFPQLDIHVKDFNDALSKPQIKRKSKKDKERAKSYV